MDWTTEQILGLAPDQFTLRAGRGMAALPKWLALHRHDHTIWGMSPNGRDKTWETAFHLPTCSFICTCKSRKSPCRHSLGLLLLWQQHPLHFTPHALNRALASWAKRQDFKHQQHEMANGRLAENPNVERLRTGLYELELWLLDMVRHGLARLPEQPKKYWQTMAHRLVDAQAITLAQRINRLAQIPNKNPGWPEEILMEIGRLHLLIQGFRHYDGLPTSAQMDLQAAVGWLPSTTDTATIQTDSWLVLGRQQEVVGSQARSMTWLWGEASQMIAQLIEPSRNYVVEGNWLPSHTVWQGPLRFAPSNWPLAAVRHGNLQEINRQISQPIGYETIRAAAESYSSATAVNPWLASFPMLLQQTQPKVTKAGWQVVDRLGNSLPLPEKFSHGWHLLSLSGGTPSLTIFGVWNGRFLRPLSVHIQDQWQDIHVWRGVR